MGNQLVFHLLGSVSITLDGEPLTGLRSRTAEALLIYLVFQERPLSREFLADFFWDERAPQQAAANLRAILSLMRKKLAPYLHITPKTVAFNHDADYWVDAVEFVQLTESMRLETANLSASSRQVIQSPIANLQRASDLYQGDFLTGFHLSESRGFEEWSLMTRERLRLLAAALGYTFQGDEATMAQLVRRLRERELLLALDEFEHLATLPGQEALAALLEQAPGVKLLVTSRARLQLRGEIVFELAGLDYPLPESRTPPESFSAVQFFLRQASRVRPGFAPDAAEMTAAAALCRLVEGMPLALELAAGGVRYFSCPEVLRQLQERLDWEYGRTPNRPARHQNLHAVFEHSWSLLSLPEQAAARRLAVFRGSFDAEAVQAVTGATAEQIMLLYDNSFLQRAESSRFALHPLLRQYLAEKLAQSPQEEAETLARHAAYYSDLIFAGSRQVNMEQRYHELASLLGRHGENVVAATLWIARQPDFLDRELDKFISLLNFYFNRSQRFGAWKTLFRQLQQALQENESQEQAREWLTAVLESRIALADIYLHAYARAQRQLEAILPQARRLENGALISACLNMLGIIALRRGEFTAAWDYGQEAATAVAHDYGPHYRFPVDRFLVEVALAARWLGKAEAANERAYQLALVVDSQAEAESVYEWNRGRIARAQGQLAAAQAHLEKALSLARAKGEPKELFDVLLALSETLLELGEGETAVPHLAEALQITETVADSRMRAQADLAQGHLAAYQADWAAARAWYEQSATLFAQIGDEANRPWALAHLGVAWAQLGEAEMAVTCLQQALAVFQAWDHETGQSLIQAGLARAQMPAPGR
ncbi:MAG: tetratricopeptide repeat protein [Chloroflexi bacterium]|nr:tetratricopeptide repeat protein [Chloroflexota bacterium]